MFTGVHAWWVLLPRPVRWLGWLVAAFVLLAFLPWWLLLAAPVVFVALLLGGIVSGMVENHRHGLPLLHRGPVSAEVRS